MAANTATTTGVSVSTLQTDGFSSEEITRLEQIRARYVPFREICENDQEYQRLSFLKWRYQRGEFNG